MTYKYNPPFPKEAWETVEKYYHDGDKLKKVRLQKLQKAIWAVTKGKSWEDYWVLYKAVESHQPSERMWWKDFEYNDHWKGDTHIDIYWLQLRSQRTRKTLKIGDLQW